MEIPFHNNNKKKQHSALVHSNLFTLFHVTNVLKVVLLQDVLNWLQFLPSKNDGRRLLALSIVTT